MSDRVGPDTARLRTFADRISTSRNPALVFGPEVDRAGGWDAAVALAEKLRAAVYGAPLLDRASFPEDQRHPSTNLAVFGRAVALCCYQRILKLTM